MIYIPTIAIVIIVPLLIFIILKYIFKCSFKQALIICGVLTFVSYAYINPNVYFPSLESQIKDDEIKIQQFKWVDYSSNGLNYQLIIESSHSEPTAMRLSFENSLWNDMKWNYLSDGYEPYSTSFTLFKGKNLVKGHISNFNFNDFKDRSKEQMIISTSNVNKPNQYIPIISALIEAPYLKIIVDSNFVVKKYGSRLYINNNGNINTNVIIERKNDIYSSLWNPCGIIFDVFPESIVVTLKAGETKYIPVSIKTEAQYTNTYGNSQSCLINDKEYGSTMFKMSSKIYRQEMTPTIFFEDIKINYRNE